MRSWWMVLALGACEGGKGEAVDDTDETPAETDGEETDVPATVELTDVITITTQTTADMTCIPTGGAPWPTQTVDPTCVELVPLQGEIEDFQSGDAAAEMSVELFFSDVPEGTPDVSATSDLSGVVTGGDVPTCTPWASRATNPNDHEAPPAIQMHWSEPHETPMNAFFNSVGSGTLTLMSALLGVDPDITRGFAAGTIYGCDADRTPVAGAQVILRAEDGTYPGGQIIHYFLEEFPARETTETSADGLFLLINVPPGAYTIEAYAVLTPGGAPELIAKTPLRLYAGSLTVADVYSGDDDGVVLPDSCTAPCAPFVAE
jgi:hypothetical protein